jgi:DOPA 4,5-dioxygenase
MGTPWPIYLDSLPVKADSIPLQYPELGLGWSTSPNQEMSFEERRRRGAEVEALLANDPEAAPAPKDSNQHRGDHAKPREPILTRDQLP